eukprot:jgi/Chlat1/5763/Chrsp387S05500
MVALPLLLAVVPRHELVARSGTRTGQGTCMTRTKTVCRAGGGEQVAADPAALLIQAAKKRDVAPEKVIEALQTLELKPKLVKESDIQGRWRLVFSSSGPRFLNYTPVEEDCIIDTKANSIQLCTYLLPADLLSTAFLGQVEWDDSLRAMHFSFDRIQLKSRFFKEPRVIKREGQSKRTYSFYFISDDKTTMAARSSAGSLTLMGKQQ